MVGRLIDNDFPDAKTANDSRPDSREIQEKPYLEYSFSPIPLALTLSAAHFASFDVFSQPLVTDVAIR